jgi:hypothetical protein
MRGVWGIGSKWKQCPIAQPQLLVALKQAATNKDAFAFGAEQ